jgi:hypothetical protein
VAATFLDTGLATRRTAHAVRPLVAVAVGICALLVFLVMVVVALVAYLVPR